MKDFFDTKVYVAEALLGEAAEKMVAATERAEWRNFASTYLLEEFSSRHCLRPGKRGDYPMDTVNAYGDVVERVLGAYAAIPYRYGDLTCEAIFDRQRGRFVLMTIGWDDGERVHHPVIHIDIMGGKLWLQANNTDCDIAAELLAAGVPKSDIVLAFRPPAVRSHTEYAVA